MTDIVAAFARRLEWAPCPCGKEERLRLKGTKYGECLLPECQEHIEQIRNSDNQQEPQMSRKYGFTVKNEKEEQQLTVSDMEIGEIALMDAPGRTDMEYVLRTFDRIVSLEDPNRTWDNIYFLDLEVRRLTNVKLAISHD